MKTTKLNETMEFFANFVLSNEEMFRLRGGMVPDAEPEMVPCLPDPQL
jgi:hypothetical protein